MMVLGIDHVLESSLTHSTSAKSVHGVAEALSALLVMATLDLLSIPGLNSYQAPT